MKSQVNTKPKILVVDDEPDNLDLLYRTFYREYKVLKAGSGPAALELLAQEGDVSVIISDQRMPMMSGTEFLSLTATQYPDIIRIILTGYTDVEDLVEAINAGKVFKYVTKPWEAEELKAVVRQALDTHNVLKARTRELCRTLRQESLLNTVTNTIRSALDYRQILQTIVDTVGHMLEVDVCLLRPFQNDQLIDEGFIYQKTDQAGVAVSGSRGEGEKNHSFPPDSLLAQTIWETREVQVINDVSDDERVQQRAAAFATANICSSLVIPLICRQELMAVLALHQCKLPRIWETDEVQLVMMVADQAALALSQARAYEQVREGRERLLELDKQKTEFFQNISHEFRTPITLIQGPLESAVASHEGLSYAQSAIALRNSRRLLRLVNQLLDLQRLDAGRMQPSFRPGDLVEFVSQIVESFRPYCEKKGLHLVTMMDQCPLVYLDTEKFDKVVYNLLSNAMKFTPEGGTITVIVRPELNHCTLQVQDTGIGIVKEQLPHLFERFRQAEGSENRSYEGSGLGLALVKELVELHGGQVTVESVYGEGTTFTVQLVPGVKHLPKEQLLEAPLELNTARASVELADLELLEVDSDLNWDSEQEADNSQSKIGPRQEPNEPKSQILVVDDNPDLRAYVSGILRDNGYQVQTARNGSEGFRKAKAILPSLIVSDLMMPLISGLEMIRMIRKEDDLKGTPIILLTAKVDEETRIEGTERGADAYLAKPFNDRELLAEVRNLLALKENERRVVELNTYLTESVLKRFLPQALVEKAAVGNLVLDLRPEPRLITVLFSDIVGFTQLANTLRSRRVAELLNEYLEEMTKAVFDNGGTVDKFMGDAILALFGAPEELTPNEQVRRAINTARAMLHSLQKLNQRWQEQGIFDADGRTGVEFRCGIHQGTAVVGMFGSSERADYTAIGPSVNIAARLQQAAAPSTILVSAAVADYLQEYEIIKRSPLELKGVDETVLTFAVTPELVVHRS
ncbi:response regulator [Iningainema tapete]|uniref:histidine kinase n=1 Tax=Iningainema tapete BLCC-T55 TaxID=2748662 RepID=A0A8J6XLC9_9CYAN|nr:response regulator [Iningainema tapete]MBD2774535.1 response regulator [Iningainema tapete BLCC-T55]